MEPIVLNDFTVNVSFEELIEKLHIEEEDDIELMQEKWQTACSLAMPKAVYRESFIDNFAGDTVTIEGITFQSPTLIEKLDGLHRVFAYVISCGTEIDDWSHQEQDPFVYLWLDELKEMILYDTEKQFNALMQERFGMKKTAAMCPGSGNLDTWPLQQQKALFELIGDVEGLIGVSLKPSLLMIPTKTVSGLLFPTEVDFDTCSLCQKENCKGRRSPYAGS